jgi:amidophosphoribosyltransferase
MNLDKPIDKSSCFFETVYFADPRTMVWKNSSTLLRYGLWQQLASEETEIFNKDDTIVIDVPKSSFDSAEGYAESMDLKHISWAITKNPDIDRTFISEWVERQDKIRKKYIFNPNLKWLIKWKKVIIIDDSIVRWATMSHLVNSFIQFYEPSEVHLRIPSPPITSPCYYATNIPTTGELITRSYFKDTINPTNEEMDNLAKYFHAKSLKYISINWLIEWLRVDIANTCLACIGCGYKTECWQKKFDSENSK